MRFAGICYRAHDPRWAWTPVSGDGAALRGGRFNAKGRPALYLSLTVEGAILEAAQGFGHRLPPLTLCSYDVDTADIADLRNETGRDVYGAALADMACAWAYDLASRRKPASWRVAEQLQSQGMAGLLAPSFATGASPAMANLVLWRWSAERPQMVRVIDPLKRLPADQSSWRG